MVVAGAGRAMPKGRDLYVILGALMLAMLLAALDQTIVSTALPTIVSDLGGLNHLSWVVTAYILAATASTPLWGKLGDQFGRKRLFQTSIVIFLAGSALCGLSGSMGQLIAFRALQGLGGGGLMVLAMAIVGDVVPPRERGRYQGIFGAVFGVASVAGPLLGGFFVDSLSWRWVFYVNLPIGVLALIAIAAVLHATSERGRHKIDYLGTVLLAGAAVCLVLMTTWGGTQYPWGSPTIIGLGVASVVLAVGWGFAERRAAEPVLPLHLFRSSVFSLASAISFVVGFAMFGALTYLSIFLQVVKGITPTLSGLHLLPMMLGLLTASITSGQVITRTGRYKIFPIFGTAITTLGLFLCSRLDETSSTFTMSVYLCVLGVGLGLVMQVLVIAVQNAVDYQDLGTATSGATFFRSIGGSFGVAAFGSVFNSRLAVNLAEALQKVKLPTGVTPETIQRNSAALRRLPVAVRGELIHAYALSIQTVFLWAAPVAAVAFVLTWFLREVPLRKTSQAVDLGEGLGGAPTSRSSLAELDRALTCLITKDSAAREMYEGLARQAGVALPAGSVWALVRVDRDGTVRGAELAERVGMTVDHGRPYVDRLVDDGLVERSGENLVITDAGRAVAGRLYEARRKGLAHLLEGWQPERNPELSELLMKLCQTTLGCAAEERLLTAERPRPAG
ncbi:MAG: Arabinose efflux permease-like protein [Actinomycetia bacterium]|nr:Arabinose efflux permease-like protein [Actinomycetes bacterium]